MGLLESVGMLAITFWACIGVAVTAYLAYVGLRVVVTRATSGVIKVRMLPISWRERLETHE